MTLWISNAANVVGTNVAVFVAYAFSVLLTFFWDTALTLLNLVLPRKPQRQIDWPPFVPRKPSDSRSPCPALNALAAHGIFPHNGRGIRFTELAAQVHQNFNFSKSFCFFVSNYMARILHRDYATDSLDLGDMNLHNGIEHDASITRYDTFHQSDQSTPAEKLILDLLATSRDGKTLTAADFASVISERRVHSKQTNPQFSLDSFHSFFGASNAAVLLKIFGGRIEDIRPFLLEERLPEGWAPRVRSRMGLTMAAFNLASLRVLLGVDTRWRRAKVRRVL